MLKSDLKTTQLRKLINANRIIQRWHNKNKHGGNFGINIYFGEDFIRDRDKEITGEYNTDGVLTSVQFGELWGHTYIIPKDAHTNLKTLADWILKEILARQYLINKDKLHTSEQEQIEIQQ